MRKCHRCKQEFPATTEFFGADKSRSGGVSYECRPCHRTRKIGRDRRTERWSNLTPEQRLKRQAATVKWGRTPRGRATFLRKAYQRIDDCDMTALEILAMIGKPCVYCGSTTDNRGLDRIDNSLPHIKGNVQTACGDCNIMRGDRFTVEEMMVIGAAVAMVKAARRQG